MARKKKKLSVNETPVRCLALANGPIKEKTCGPAKGKKQYSRKQKHKKGWD
jgi:hypothetical protein